LHAKGFVRKVAAIAAYPDILFIEKLSLNPSRTLFRAYIFIVKL